MGKLDELIADLARDGQVAAEGGFSLDREKAREKMREFQLPDPRRYVLLVVQAAVLRGATRIDLRIDTDDVEIRFDGEPWTHEDVSELWSSMFVDRKDARLAARQELAMALNAAMALHPRWIRLVSGQGPGAVHLEMRPEQRDEVTRVEHTGGTLVHVKDRFRPGSFVRFVQSVSGKLAEEQLVRQHCRYASIPVHLGATLVSLGLDLGDVVAPQQATDTGTSLQLGFAVEGGDARLDLVCNGVWIVSHELPDWPTGMRAIVDTSRLRKDASQFDVVRDEAYAAVLEALREPLDRALVELANTFAPVIAGVPFGAPAEDAAPDPADPVVLVDPSVPAWLPATLRTVLAERPTQPGPLVTVLRALRLFTTLSGRHESADGLHALGEKIPMSCQAYPDIGNTVGKDVVFAPDLSTREVLRQLFGDRLVDLTRTMRAACERERNRQRWRARPQPAKLPSAMYEARASVAAEGIVGDIGLRVEDPAELSIRFVLEGCLLGTRKVAFAVPRLTIVVEAAFEPLATYDGPQVDDKLADVARACADALENVFSTLADGHALTDAVRPSYLAYMLMRRRRQVLGALLEAFGFREGLAAKQVRRMGGEAELRLRLTNPPQLPVSTRPELPHALARVRVFPTLSEPVLTLQEVHVLRRRLGKIPFVPLENAMGIELPDDESGEEDLAAADDILVLDVAARDVAAAVFGVDTCESYAERVEVWRRRAEFRRRTPAAFDLFESVIYGPHRRDEPGVRVQVGLAWRRVADGSIVAQGPGSVVRVLKWGRSLCRVTVPSPIPHVVAVIDLDEVATNADYTALAEDALNMEVAPRVLDAVGELLVERMAAEGADATQAILHRRLWQWCLTIAFSSRTWLSAWWAWRSAHGPEKARDLYDQALSARDRLDVFALASQLDEALAGGATPDISRVLAAANKPGTPQPETGLRRALAQRAEVLATLPLFRALDGRNLSLTDMMSALAAGVELHVLPQAPLDLPPLADVTVLVLDDADRRVIEWIMPPDALRDATPLVEQARRRKAFEGRTAVTSLELPADRVLVRVAVDTDGLRGEVGLPLGLPTEARTRIRIAQGGRELAVVGPSLPLPMEGILDAPSFTLPDTADRLTPADEAALLLVLELQAEPLARALAELWRDGSPANRDMAQRWVVHVLTTRGAKSGRFQDPVVVALIDLPIVPRVGEGPISLRDIRAYHRAGIALECTLGPCAHALEPATLDARDPDIKTVLGAVFGRLVDVAERLDREAERAQRARDRERLPERPLDSLAHHREGDESFAVEVWATTKVASRGVWIGRDGYRVARHGTPLPVGGVITGTAVVPDRDRAQLTRAQRRKFNDTFAELARSLAREVHAATARRDDDRTQAQVAMLEEFTAALNRLDGEWVDELRNELAAVVQSHRTRGQPSGPAQTSAPAEPEAARPAKPTRKRAEDLHGPFLEAVRAELRKIRRGNEKLLGDGHLGLVGMRPGAKKIVVAKHVLLDVEQPFVAQALERWRDDPVLVSFFASAVYSGLNAALGEITDHDESAFATIHVRHVAADE